MDDRNFVFGRPTEDVFQVVERRRTDDGRGDSVFLQRPRDRDLRHRDVHLLRHLFDSAHASPRCDSDAVEMEDIF